MAAIGAYLLFFGLWYKLSGDLWTYLTVTGSIYLSSMSVLLIACCYWKRANDWGAGGAIIFGAVIPVAFLILEKLPGTSFLSRPPLPYYTGIVTYVMAALAMFVGSMLKPNAANRDRPEWHCRTVAGFCAHRITARAGLAG